MVLIDLSSARKIQLAIKNLLKIDYCLVLLLLSTKKLIIREDLLKQYFKKKILKLKIRYTLHKIYQNTDII